MTQMSPPPPPGAGASYYVPSGKPPLSALAVAAFVLSLLGLTAPVGLVLGIAALFATSGGKKRGQGFAIASIPISLVTGVGCLGCGGVMYMSGRLVFTATETADALQRLLAADSDTYPSEATAFRGLLASSFSDSLSDEQLQRWVEGVREKHGQLMSHTLPQSQTQPAPGRVEFPLDGKFTNGPATIVIEFSFADLKFQPVNITIGDLSLAEPAASD